ncbi:hypothetical protein ATY41_05760 [Leifsonia xyli subsp. xyli]|uniref:UDP-N-acetylglucosamine 2-epimerase domain-containing protein n=1 Tax=Leifsonia xyli subsp. xyli TaxID=59736 RepID=A0A1E2SHS1_LEIXY|nr:hypothetical protein ATY41_05760 [Leifsonia xyli subsp. xyli]
MLATIHRPENTDSADALARVLRGLRQIDSEVLFVAHPRTRAAIKRFRLDEELVGIRVIPSVITASSCDWHLMRGCWSRTSASSKRSVLC